MPEPERHSALSTYPPPPPPSQPPDILFILREQLQIVQRVMIKTFSDGQERAEQQFAELRLRQEGMVLQLQEQLDRLEIAVHGVPAKNEVTAKDAPPQTASLEAITSDKRTVVNEKPKYFVGHASATSNGTVPQKDSIDTVKEVVEIRQSSPGGRAPTTVSTLRSEADKLAEHNSTGLGRILSNPLFDTVCAVMIFGNSVLIGIEVEYMVTHDKNDSVILVLGHLCNVFFFVELVLRISHTRLRYFLGDDIAWNMFDFSLVLFSVVELFTELIFGQDGPASFTSGMKVLKMLRIIRIFRVFRFLKDLVLLVLMIADSVKSLVWALIMLSIILFVFAICFTTQATDFLKDNPDHPVAQMAHKQFGSLPHTTYFLLQSMLAGISWGEVSDTLIEIGWFPTVLFMFYIMFSLLAVLNIITGVFVDNAVHTAKSQRDFLLAREACAREKMMREMTELFNVIDDDKSGFITWPELVWALKEESIGIRITGFFTSLGLGKDDMQAVFELVDDDESGEVDVGEFLRGCMKLKGEARSIDVHQMLRECRKLHRTHTRTTAQMDHLIATSLAR